MGVAGNLKCLAFFSARLAANAFDNMLKVALCKTTVEY
jgi:hypothetical protein